MNIWKPSKAEKQAIRDYAAQCHGIAGGNGVTLEIGKRYNIDGKTDVESINGNLVTDCPNWDDTDLADHVSWTEFCNGVELDSNGMAKIDFYVYSKGRYGELEGNIQAIVALVDGVPTLRGFGSTMHYDSSALHFDYESIAQAAGWEQVPLKGWRHPAQPNAFGMATAQDVCELERLI